MVNFRPVDRATSFLLPPSVEDWLPKDHLSRFVVDIVDQLDLSALTRQYRGAGSDPYHPTVMLGLLVYGYATGVYSSRRIEAATHDSIAFRYIAANQQPDHNSLCTFRRRFLKELGALFVQVLVIARQMKLLKLGTIALDGTKVHANASRHSALSYGHAQKIEAQLEAEVKALFARAEAADAESLPKGMSIPKELARREARLAAIRQAKAQIEARAAERDALAQAEFDAKMKALEQKTERTGKKPGGKPRRTSPALGGSIHRAATTRRACQRGGPDEASAQDEKGAQALRQALADGGTGVRHHQVGDALPAVLVAWLGGRARGVEVGHHGMEYQKNGGVGRINGHPTVRSRSAQAFSAQFAAPSLTMINIVRITKSSQTGC